MSEADRYLVELAMQARGKGSGIEIDVVLGQIWTFRDGLIWRVVAFATPEAARAELGRAT